MLKTLLILLISVLCTGLTPGQMYQAPEYSAPWGSVAMEISFQKWQVFYRIGVRATNKGEMDVYTVGGIGYEWKHQAIYVWPFAFYYNLHLSEHRFPMVIDFAIYQIPEWRFGSQIDLYTTRIEPQLYLIAKLN